MKRLRKLHKTQRDLAAAIYYSPSHLCDVIHGGKYSPELQNAAERVLERWENEMMLAGKWKI